MARKKIEPQINLLPQEEFDTSSIGRVLKWLLTTFRYIVITTEMIVMIAFLSRFWLDAKSGDLIDKITQQTAIISSYSKFEDQFRQIQDKLNTFKKFAIDNKGLGPIIDDIAAKIPINVTLTDLNISDTKIQITAESDNDQAAASFLANLNSSSFFNNMVVMSVQSKQGGIGTTFIINGDIKGRVANGS